MAGIDDVEIIDGTYVPIKTSSENSDVYIRLSNISLPPFCILNFAAMYKALQSSYLATLYTI